MFTSTAARIAGTMVAENVLPKGPRVLELGAQTYSANAESIVFLSRLFNKKGIPDVSKNLEKFLSIKPAHNPRDPGVPHTSEFFKALGFVLYEAIDISDYGGTRIMDLNEDLAEKYGFNERYDLVTNLGVSEHLFNQATFFKNAHETTKVGGYMVHIVPSVHFANHGFFNYQPRFFQDMAAANNYRIVELYLADRNNKVLDLLRPSKIGMFFYPLVPFLSGDETGNLLVVAVLQKVSDAPFRTPLQGKYVPDVTDTADRGRYDVSDDVISVPTKGYFRPGTETISIRIQRKLIRYLRALLRFVLTW